MKKILMILLLACGVVACKGPGDINPFTDWKNDLMQGKVKSVAETSYRVFEDAGAIVFGEKISDLVKEYTPEGILKQDDNIQVKCDKWGNVLSRIHYTSGTATATENYKYDASGRMIEKNVVESGETFRVRYRYKDNFIKEIRTHINGGLYSIEKRYREGDKVKVNVYDAAKQLIGRMEIDFEEDVQRAYEKTDAEGKLLFTTRYDLYGNILSHRDYKYDWNQSFEYEYDSKGNWVRRLVYFDNNIQYVEIRKIQYYD